MRPFVVDDNVKEKISKLLDYADMHVLNIDDLLDLKNKQRDPVGDDPNHVIDIPFGFRIVYSIETHPELGSCRHLSVSVDSPGGLPHTTVVLEIMKLFEFRQTSLMATDIHISLENIAPGHQAVNIIAVK